MATLVEHQERGEDADTEDQPPGDIVGNPDRQHEKADEVGGDLAEDVEDEGEADESASTSASCLPSTGTTDDADIYYASTASMSAPH